MTKPNPASHSIGIEIEFTGLSARQAIVALQAKLGGAINVEDAHAYELSGSAIGDLFVELDIRHAHPQRHGAALTVKPGRTLSALFGSLVSPIVPREAIFPPRSAESLIEIDRAVAILRQAGATGDGRIYFGTLGLHFNIATPTDDVAVIHATALAFARMDSQLRRLISEDDHKLMAQLAPAYPRDYVRLLESKAYAPRAAGAFIDDYLAYNATRDRALDLLPLLLSLDGPRVRRRLPYEKIAARPVFHWRLPVARVGRPNWSILGAWRAWLDVEAEAARILSETRTDTAQATGTSAPQDG